VRHIPARDNAPAHKNPVAGAKAFTDIFGQGRMDGMSVLHGSDDRLPVARHVALDVDRYREARDVAGSHLHVHGK